MVTLPTIDINAFLSEDIGSGDMTAMLIAQSKQATAQVITRENMVVCGQAWFEAVFKTLDPEISVRWLVAEAQEVAAGTLLCELSGSARALLTGERSGLNLLQTLSATATVARQYANAVAGTQCKVLDTRKTIPGLRLAQKYAVACGGCENHRIGLYDGILIKENHIIAAGSIVKAVKAAREQSNLTVEVEVESIAELKLALLAKPDRILLDNFSLSDLQQAVALNDGQLELEASGDITLDNIRAVAETGVNFISIGALTKHIKAIDLSMRINLEDTKMKQLNELVKQITHGVYVIGVSDGEHRNAFTASWVMQVSFDPLLLAFSINPQHHSYRMLRASGVCAITVLKQGQTAVAEHFARSHIDKMSGYQWQQGKSDAPILMDGSAFFDCKVKHYLDAGDHKIVICDVLDAGYLAQGQPMLYSETGDMDGSSQFLPEKL